MADPQALLTVSDRDGVVVLEGEVDASTAELVAARLAAVDAAAEVRVDFSGVEFMDSAGLRTLIAAHHERVEAGGSLILVNPSRAVARLFDMAGVAEYLSIEGLPSDDA